MEVDFTPEEALEEAKRRWPAWQSVSCFLTNGHSTWPRLYKVSGWTQPHRQLGDEVKFAREGQGTSFREAFKDAEKRSQ